MSWEIWKFWRTVSRQRPDYPNLYTIPSTVWWQYLVCIHTTHFRKAIVQKLFGSDGKQISFQTLLNDTKLPVKVLCRSPDQITFLSSTKWPLFPKFLTKQISHSLVYFKAFQVSFSNRKDPWKFFADFLGLASAFLANHGRQEDGTLDYNHTWKPRKPTNKVKWKVLYYWFRINGVFYPL